jgi:hypothetical protein
MFVANHTTGAFGESTRRVVMLSAFLPLTTILLLTIGSLPLPTPRPIAG